LGVAVEQHLTRYFSTFAPELPPDGLSHRIAEAVDKPLMRAAMVASRGNQIRAAKLLGVNRNTLRKRLGDLGIDPSLGRPVRR
jgi:two-component system, NtrC family, nitrogen regulation response regulator GlnG